MTAWVGHQFEPFCLHHPVFRTLTPFALGAFALQEQGFFLSLRVSVFSLSGRKEAF